jgi:5'-3' exonuclease
MMCRDRTRQEIFYDIFKYIDELVHLIKPRKLLMISADGVAPRAKMNQQRTRRFRKTEMSAKEAEALRKQGLDPEKMFNSDMISAGTEFMHELSKSFDAYVNEKMQTDSLWKSLNVIVTGADVPGEGEHKIIEYIRNYKNSNEYKDDTKHCLYGLDADLIMLSLITHEPNISILREDSTFIRRSAATESNYRSSIKIQEPFEFIFVSILREYLELEFLEIKTKLNFEYNIERIIDDFIFFCFFIGNDFLPNLNTLDIENGALEHIFLYYKEVLPTLDDYITYHGKIDFKKAEKIFNCLAKHELNSIQNMLRKVESSCLERERKKKRAIKDRKKLLKMQKLMTRKENFLITLKEKDLGVIINFKKEKVNKKIDSFKKRYEEEMANKGNKEFRFEEDLQNFVKIRLNKQIKALNDKDKDMSERDDILRPNSESNQSLSEKEPESDSNTKIKSKNNLKLEPIESNKGLVCLFDSDDEVTNKNVQKEKEKKELVSDNVHKILNDVSKYNKYILDENYCSDINVDDIDEGDIGIVSEPEINFEEIDLPREYAEKQDLDKEFQEKMVNLYITDVTKAKAFYYKEKLGIDLDTIGGQQEHKKMFRKYLEGLQWVLFYYYRGVQSWRWYYPYHYAPMISDFNKIREYIDYDVESSILKDKPFNPFESLLFILPKKSQDLIPPCYWSVFEEFPELYPDNFKIDFNGKRMPWESIVLLPFLCENTILNFESRSREKYHSDNSHLLSEHEKRLAISHKDLERNIHGKSYFYTYDKDEHTIKKQLYEIYCETTLTNLDSNYQQKTVDYHFPTMKTIYYDYLVESKKQYMGKPGTNSVKYHKVFSVKPILSNGNMNEENIRSILNQGDVVYVNYPFKQEARLRGIYFNDQYYYMNSLQNNKITVDNKRRVKYELKDIIKRDLNKKGINFDYLDILCEVNIFKMLGRSNDGSITKIYENSSILVPFEITSLNSRTKDFFNLNEEYKKFVHKFSNLKSEFSNEKVCVVLSKVSFGMLGKVTNVITKSSNTNYNKYNNDNYSKYYDENFNFDLSDKDWEVPIDKLYNGPLLECKIVSTIQSSAVTEIGFTKNIIKKSEEEYLNMNELSKKLGISTWSLGLITSSLYVVNCVNDFELNEETKLVDLEYWNIGLNLKMKSKSDRLVLPGFTRYIENYRNLGESQCWEFSKNAQNLLLEYKEKFPFVFESLEKYSTLYNRSNKYFKVFEIFSSIDNFHNKLNEVAVWINSHQISTLKFASYQSNFLSISDCRRIEEYIANKNKILKKNQMTDNFSHTLVLNPNYLYQEDDDCWIPPFISYEPAPFQLGDRVVNIRSSDIHYIPFGEKGTVTAISNDFIEVMFDNPFLGGSTGNGRFSTHCSAYVKPLNLINLTK